MDALLSLLAGPPAAAPPAAQPPAKKQVVKKNVAPKDVVQRAKESGLPRTDEEVLDGATAALLSMGGGRPEPRRGVRPPPPPTRTAYEVALSRPHKTKRTRLA